MRKNLIAFAAIVALGATALATSALAQQRGGTGTMGGGGAPHASFGGGGTMGGGAPHASFGGGATMGGAPHGNFGAATAPNGFARSAPGNGGPGNFAGPQTNFAGRDFDHDRHGRGFGRGFGPGFGVGIYAFGGPAYYDYNNDYDYVGDSCWQRQLVPTPYGWRWRLVDVCE
jgi:hypothetical protein